MLSKPPSCSGCALFEEGIGFMAPSLSPKPYGVTLIGEALGAEEAEAGRPFVGPAGFRLTRLIEWAGLDRSRFDIINTVWCRPPANKLDGMEYEDKAIAHCRERHWGTLLARSRVLVPLGNVALHALTGRKGILAIRGYVQPGPGGSHVLPTVHPSFIQRGQSKYSAAFIRDLRHAVEVAERGLRVEPVSYLLDPSPREALEWAREYRRVAEHGDEDVRLAYDIETPGKGDDEGEVDTDDPTFTIFRIGFAYRPLEALSIPWGPAYIPAIRLLLESPGEKVVWNAGYDNPRIRAAGVGIHGLIHDGMVAWHVLHSDLPKGLGFVATFTCPSQPQWKHLSGSRPAFYNATDADVELRSFLAIEKELREVGLWRVYQEDVLDLEPILQFMSEVGVPVDREVRADRARRLAEKQERVRQRLEALTPPECRSYKPKEGYVKAPPDTAGCVRIVVPAHVRRCSLCGVENPTKPHFRTFKKPTAKRPQNPCAGGGVVEAEEMVERWARLDPYTPSRHMLIRYQKALGRQVPRKRDKKSGEWKASMDEKAIKDLMRKYGDDDLYPAVLEYRELDKLAGTYIGRPGGEREVPEADSLPDGTRSEEAA